MSLPFQPSFSGSLFSTARAEGVSPAQSRVETGANIWSYSITRFPSLSQRAKGKQAGASGTSTDSQAVVLT